MIGTKEYIESRAVLNNISNNAIKESEALVTFANEYENVCHILYKGKDRVTRLIENVSVDVLAAAKDWFPVAGQVVMTRDAGNNRPVIISPRQEDYQIAVQAGQFDMTNMDSLGGYGIGGYCDC